MTDAHFDMSYLLNFWTMIFLVICKFSTYENQVAVTYGAYVFELLKEAL